MSERGYLDISQARYDSVPVPQSWVDLFSGGLDDQDPPQPIVGQTIALYLESIGHPGGPPVVYNDGIENRVIFPVPWDLAQLPADQLQSLTLIRAAKADMDAAFQGFATSWVYAYVSASEARCILRAHSANPVT